MLFGSHLVVDGALAGVVEEVRAEVHFTDGRFVVTELTLRAPGGVTGAALRQVAVERLLRQCAERVHLMRVTGPGRAVPVTRPPETSDPDHHHYVAALYRLAHAVALPPTAHVAAQTGVSRATASRWIAACREEGLLGEARGPRAGEQQDDLAAKQGAA